MVGCTWQTIQHVLNGLVFTGREDIIILDNFNCEIAKARPDPAGASVLKFKPQRMKRRGTRARDARGAVHVSRRWWDSG